MENVAKYPIIKNPTEYKDDYYYFFDLQLDFSSPVVIGVSKSARQQDVIEWKKKFIFRPEKDASFFDYLFLGKKCPIDKKEYHYIFIENPSNASLVKETFKELFLECYIYDISKDVLIIYFDLDEITTEHLLSISDDLGVSLKTFSGKMSIKNTNLLNIYAMYRKCYYGRKYDNITINDILLETFKSSYDDYLVFRELILNDVLKDYQIQDLLMALFKNNLNVTQTANDVYMHRNTINNKLALIEKETGLNPQNFNDAVTLYILLKMK